MRFRLFVEEMGMPPMGGMPGGSPPMGGGAGGSPMGGGPPPMGGMPGMGGPPPMGGMGGPPMGGMQQTEPPVIPKHGDVWEVLDAILHHKSLQHDKKEQKPTQNKQPNSSPLLT